MARPIRQPGDESDELPPGDDPTAEEDISRRLAQGVEAARRIEHTVDLIGRARRHARDASSKRERRHARRRLRKLRDRLEELQKESISQGVSARGTHILVRQLDPVDEGLARFLAKKPKKRRLRALADLADEAMRLLQFAAIG